MIDDDHNDLALFGVAVQTSPHDLFVCSALGVEAALQYLQHLREFGPGQLHPQPDLLLLDIVMPPVSGFEFLQEWAATEWSKSIPVLVFSGSDDPAILQKALSLGVEDVLRKPCSFADWQLVVSRIHAFLSERHACRAVS